MVKQFVVKLNLWVEAWLILQQREFNISGTSVPWEDCEPVG